METLEGLKRTDYCGTLTAKDVGRTVTLCGWVQRQRDLGSLIFIDLRDRTGIVQLAFDENTDKAVFDKAFSARSEYVLAAVGKVRERSAKNTEIATGEIEVEVTELRILGKSETPPFEIVPNCQTAETTRLKYRYLDLRRPDLQKNILLRHKITKITRDYFDENGFIEIETPMLIRSTPEGARDFLVPSRIHNGSFYALPQSPQLYKQLSMVAGFDRYMQIARCFRDEDLRADRQPEFTQIDVEMSFVDSEDVMSINEAFIKKLLKETLNVDVGLPLKRITYSEAMERYGSDKPDTRFELELINVGDLVMDCGFKVFTDALLNGGSVRCINAKGASKNFTRKGIDELTELVKIYGAKGLAWVNMKPDGMQCSFAKFMTDKQMGAIIERTGAQAGDIIFFVADPSNETVFASLGALRLELAKRLDLIKKGIYDLLWVTDFPLLEWDEEEGRYVAKHHPFTSPKDEDLELLDTTPLKVRAKAYDMVLNGNEIGGGSIRIHSMQLQERMFELLGFSKEQAWERFGFLMEAFKYGTPPHGGIAYGLDRLVMIIAGTDNIRDVIAFPKVQTAACLMSNAPDFVEERQLEELRIKLDTERAWNNMERS